IYGDEAPRTWQQFVDAESDGKLLTIDAVDPRVLRLPWELLADEGGHLFSQDIGVRRRLKKVTATPVKPFDLPVRVLVVVSRPDDKDAGFIDPRAVSLPLLDALDELGDRVAVEFLYPPTLKALTARLRDRSAPPVHVVHFDGHGVYDAGLGLGYLLFENERHEKDRVDANRLGTLLNRRGVPLMVLNACQSAAQEEANPYASVAARLIRAGVGSVLAMNYSVLVVAAKKFVAAFYGSLAGGLTVGRAVDEGRYALMADVERHTLTRRDAEGNLVEETIRLCDWFLPALYQQSADPVVFGAGPHPPAPSPKLRERGRLPRALADPNVPGGLPPDPLHGFHGRAREMLQLERGLAEHSVVVLHGFGGMGKTALAAEAGRWFHRTGRFPGGAAFVSFEHGGSLSQLCSWVAQAVSGDPDFLLGERDPVARVAALLREHPALVILDNFESLLGREPLMPAEELREVLDTVWTWATGSPLPKSGEGLGEGARILITTRDTTFNDARFGPSQACVHIGLGGLARDDALALAAAVLDDHGIDRATVGRQELVDLMEYLGGHPLSLYLVLPHLREYTPAELTARFEELLPGFTAGAATERNESLAVSLEFSLRRLGDETRAALPDLAVFQGSAFEDDMLEITQMDPELWQTARAELEQAALVTVESLPGIEPPF
ncbi:MAG: CHAT domain-containing protein, partial [Chloroflexi bacterium]|nr:CHAT domain-containing protein [Chloroflexota bacterium]